VPQEQVAIAVALLPYSEGLGVHRGTWIAVYVLGQRPGFRRLFRALFDWYEAHADAHAETQHFLANFGASRSSVVCSLQAINSLEPDAKIDADVPFQSWQTTRQVWHARPWALSSST
jgi:hypothetical protein